MSILWSSSGAMAHPGAGDHDDRSVQRARPSTRDGSGSPVVARFAVFAGTPRSGCIATNRPLGHAGLGSFREGEVLPFQDGEAHGAGRGGLLGRRSGEPSTAPCRMCR